MKKEMRMLVKATKCLTLLCLLFILAGCAGSSANIMHIINDVAYHPELPEERRHLRVGVVPGPYGEMFMDAIEPTLAARGYTVELVLFNDFIQPNHSLAQGETELNIFQHNRFLNSFKFEHNLELSPIAEVPTVSMGIFSAIYAELEDINEGAVVAIPNDATNLARALRVLQSSGLISLNPLTDAAHAIVEDIVRNPRGLAFNLIEASQLVSELGRSDLAVITGGFAYAGGLDIAGALYNEFLVDGYMIVVTVRTEDLARNFVSDILDVIHSGNFKDVIIADDSPFNGFQRPRYFFQ
ncbi:MAG: MetQ/NlpA family ABC transporter substrate-binding protein [Defluviitaleaceae bacterium]|nr:MetQ/NlpA family ABC transporter substrate-binding protein [Defluviitaleaceae bacterium]